MSAPECCKCGETYPAQRHALGYTTCLDCGDADAAAARAGWCIAPAAHKGHLTRVTDPGHLKKINKYANE